MGRKEGWKKNVWMTRGCWDEERVGGGGRQEGKVEGKGNLTQSTFAEHTLNTEFITHLRLDSRIDE